jgi:hypothetical protein
VLDEFSLHNPPYPLIKNQIPFNGERWIDVQEFEASYCDFDLPAMIECLKTYMPVVSDEYEWPRNDCRTFSANAFNYCKGEP